MNQRKNIYGEWEYGLVNMDADSQTLIEDHPFIESKGKIQIYGVLAGSYMDNKQANIGTMDQTAWNIGHLQMLKGHLPENEQEIAMESGMLTALGYQGEPGAKIEACACYLIASITGMGLGTLTYLAAMKGWEKILGYPLAAKVTGKAYAGTLFYSFFVISFS